MTRFYLPKERCIHILTSSCCFLIYHSGSCSCREYLTLSKRQQCLPKPNLPIFMEAGFEHPSGVGLTQPSQTRLSGQFGRHHSTVSHSQRVVFLLSLPRWRRNPRRRSSFLLTPLLHFTVVALLSSAKSPSFSCFECGKVQHFLFHL